jgi:hypothetical protein
MRPAHVLKKVAPNVALRMYSKRWHWFWDGVYSKKFYWSRGTHLFEWVTPVTVCASTQPGGVTPVLPRWFHDLLKEAVKLSSQLGRNLLKSAHPRFGSQPRNLLKSVHPRLAVKARSTEKCSPTYGSETHDLLKSVTTSCRGARDLLKKVSPVSSRMRDPLKKVPPVWPRCASHSPLRTIYSKYAIRFGSEFCPAPRI